MMTEQEHMQHEADQAEAEVRRAEAREVERRMKRGTGKWLAWFALGLLLSAALVASPLFASLGSDRQTVTDLSWKRIDTLDDIKIFHAQCVEGRVPSDAVNVECAGRPRGYVCELNGNCDPTRACTYDIQQLTTVRTDQVYGTGNEVIKPRLEAKSDAQKVTQGVVVYTATVSDGKHTWPVSIDRETYLRSAVGSRFLRAPSP